MNIKIKKKDKYTNKNKDEINNNKNNQKNASALKKPEMWTELDLDKYRNPSKIRIKINNPFYPFYNFLNNNNQTVSLNKIKKRTKFLDNTNIYKKDTNQDTIRIKNRKQLGPLKIKRITKTNSTSSVYSAKSDAIGKTNDYNFNINYFKNKEIANAIGHKNGRNCQACNSIKNPINKINVKSFQPELRNNNFFNEENFNKKKKKYIEDINSNNYYSYNKDKIKNKKINKNKNKNKNQSKMTNSSLSTKYANVINIEFPALNSYFH